MTHSVTPNCAKFMFTGSIAEHWLFLVAPRAASIDQFPHSEPLTGQISLLACWRSLSRVAHSVTVVLLHVLEVGVSLSVGFRFLSCPVICATVTSPNSVPQAVADCVLITAYTCVRDEFPI